MIIAFSGNRVRPSPSWNRPVKEIPKLVPINQMKAINQSIPEPFTRFVRGLYNYCPIYITRYLTMWYSGYWSSPSCSLLTIKNTNCYNWLSMNEDCILFQASKSTPKSIAFVVVMIHYTPWIVHAIYAFCKHRCILTVCFRQPCWDNQTRMNRGLKWRQRTGPTFTNVV